VDLTVVETGKATGVFEGYVTFTSKDQSSGSKLRVTEGDFVTARYEDNTLPAPYTRADELKISANTMIGLVHPPLERAPAGNLRLVDTLGNSVTQVNVGKQIQVTADIFNSRVAKQPFVYFVQVQDSDGAVQSLSWISGNINKGQAFSPSASWLPEEPGEYDVSIFVWSSLTNPMAISPSLEMKVTVSE
ncbi:MAG: hypothetical protein HKM23_05260, partial [Nitrosopumilus sp.]|nr:hypothetical protein [Nitrosopumilus sp.]